MPPQPILAPWWVRPGVQVREGRLTIAGRDAEALAREHGTPLYVYEVERVREQARALQGALTSAGLRPRVRLALKAQRQPGVLSALRSLGAPGTPQSVGMDVCSPGELLHALENGWEPQEISYTSTNVSERDLDVVLARPVHLNVDLVSQLHRVGRRAPGRLIGLRVNPRAGAAWEGGGETKYSGERPTKFGIYPDRLDEALAGARRYDLTIDTVHFHVGDGYLTEQLPAFERALARVAEMTRRLLDAGCPIVEVNCGGGLGVPQVEGDEPLDLDAWAAVLARYLGPLDVAVGTEPGDFLVKESGILLAEVVTVEARGELTFVGLDVGWNAAAEHFVYGAELPVVLARAADSAARGPVTFAGHINEGDDLFGRDLPFPAVAEGDIVALLNVGSYNQSTYSVHCLRDDPKALILERPRSVSTSA
jgi:diaminopimelate decarboxylase